MRGSKHSSTSIAKVLYMGHSGSGKTGSLVSLLKAGYKLRVIDTDNLIGTLVAYARRDCPDLLDNLEFEAIRDKYKASSRGPIIDGQPKAYVQCLQTMDKWPDGTIPQEWGPDYVLVIDTLTTFSKTAFAWAIGLNPNVKDPRQWYNVAQDAVMKNIDLITSEYFHCNVIVNAHIRYQEAEQIVQGFPHSIGSAIGPIIPTSFNTVLAAEKRGSGSALKRIIRTVPSALINLKNPVPFKLKDEYPLESGLAEIFAKLKEQ